jgi:predicted dehydrogenase
MPEVELVGVVDVDGARARAVAADLHCQAYTDPQALLGKIDAVSIVVPTIYHLDTARPFLDNGVHMLMEKPLAPTYEESLQLVEIAEQAGVIFQVGHLERFNAGVMALAGRVSNPRFLEVHRLGTFVERATDVDVVTDLMIHDIDIVSSLVKSNIRNIAASGIPVITDHIDIANARLEYENGAVANVTASRVSNKQHRRIRVFEAKHYYGLNYVDQQLEVVTARPPGSQQKWPEIVKQQVEVKPCLPLNAELAQFIHSVQHNNPPLVTGRVGLEAVRVAHIIKEKMSECLQ